MSNKEKITGNVFDYKLLRRVLGLSKPYRSTFIFAFILALVLAGLSILRPLLIMRGINTSIKNFDAQSLLWITIIMIGALIFEAAFRYQFIYTTRWLGQTVIKNLRVRVFDHVLKLRLKYFDQTPIGTATTRTINDVETINDIYAQGILQIFADVVLLVGVLVTMFIVHWKLALVGIAILPLLLWATYIFKEGVKGAFQTVRVQVSKMNSFLQERISGMKIVQIFAAEKKEIDKFNEINNTYKKAYIKSIWYYSIFFPVVEVLLAIGTGALVWFGVWLILDKQITDPGAIIAFVMFINMMFRPLRFIADRFNNLQMGLVASNRVFTLLDRDETISDIGNLEPETLKGEISFKDVWFAYNEEDYVLKNINFSIQPGETLAIVGATGSGKTSTINILNKFYPINKGQILIDGIDINEFKVEAIRKQISVVLQDVFLFSGSIMDNLTLRNDNISREDAINAAKLIGAHEFIEKLPNGYDYQVMERGATLSVGQRQLISFARALVFDPSILVLDEATSSIDTESEHIIQNAIDKLISNRTSIVIAHRLSTIQRANKILVLDKGEIKEVGTHNELLAKDGFYKKLHDMQFAKPEAAA